MELKQDVYAEVDRQLYELGKQPSKGSVLSLVAAAELRAK